MIYVSLPSKSFLVLFVVFGSIIHLELNLAWRCEGIQFHFIFYGYPIDPVLFIKETDSAGPTLS
jgi:hypothetical protein